MRISHEAIYQALYVQGRGALKRELVACLRTGRALRVPKARTQQRGKKFVSPEIMITQRPAEADDRRVPGHWEGDLILGLQSSAIGTLVERTTRFTMLLHLPRMPGHGQQQRVHNGPPLAGHGAQAVRDAIAESIATLPQQLRRSLAWDQGTEMAQHAQLRIDTDLDIYFCDPQSPWQRGTNENTNGLLRQYFPKGTDLSRHSRGDLDAVAAALNSRPAKPSAGRPPPRPSTNTYTLSNKTLLRRPLEPEVHIPAVTEFPVVDTTGAGDGFAGGFLAVTLAGGAPAQAGKVGTLVAALIIAEAGGHTGSPSLDKLRDLAGRLGDEHLQETVEILAATVRAGIVERV